jgi:hypothetical protein
MKKIEMGVILKKLENEVSDTVFCKVFIGQFEGCAKK